MGRRYKIGKVVNQVGFCNNVDLPYVASNEGGHYVYIRKYNKKTGICKVSTITSLEDEKDNIKTERIPNLRNGRIYPIPKKDANFNLWSGVNMNYMYVHRSKIHNIGDRWFLSKHKLPIGKKKKKK